MDSNLTRPDTRSLRPAYARSPGYSNAWRVTIGKEPSEFPTYERSTEQPPTDAEGHLVLDGVLEHAPMRTTDGSYAISVD